jgi:hypothetical protein
MSFNHVDYEAEERGGELVRWCCYERGSGGGAAWGTEVVLGVVVASQRSGSEDGEEGLG